MTGFGPTDPEIAAGYSRWRNLVYCKRSLSNREIAAYLGHRLIWQRIIDDGHAYALVLEDEHLTHDRLLLAKAGLSRLAVHFGFL